LYVFAGYPLLLACACRLKKKSRPFAPFTGSISIVLAVRNEEANLERRLRELTGLLKASHCAGEILVVSDGSTDRTAALARRWEAGGLVRLFERPRVEGKAAALTLGCRTCQSDVLVFADARQYWAPYALARLLETF